jgi:uncharacterized membrane protein (DUF4010 family)
MTFISSSSAMSLVVALGIGILIGAERERRKGGGSHRGAAGVRTFALAAFAGALSSYLKSEALLVVVAAAAILFSALAYRRGARQDPGLTTELALLVTVLLGGLSMQQPLLAAGLAVIITLLLAGRERLHYVFKNLLSEQEAHDALMFLAAALVMLPLSPNREFGPLGILNPRKICELVVLVMAVSAAGYLMLRLLGARLGLAVAGFLGGFISASATIGSMGRRMRRSPELEGAATSGAVLTTVATVLQMLLVLLATNAATFRALALPLLLAGIAAMGYALLFVVKSPKTSGQEPAAGKAFDLRTAVLFAVSISAILFFCAFLNQRYGSRGLFLGAAISGLADTHATAISIASMVSSGKLGPRAAVLPILLGFTANSLTKSVVAFAMGGFRFGLKIFLGLTLVVSAAFLGVWLTR